MPDAPVQTLSAGQSIAQQYGSFGASGGEVTGFPELDRLFMLFMGRKNSGKTTLLEDNPGVLVLNFDGSTIPVAAPGLPRPQAQFWPIRSASGAFSDASGKAINFDFEAAIGVKDKLIEAAKKDLPRPKLISIDSVTAALRMAKDYIVDQSVKLGISKDKKEAWRNLNGQSAYDVLYDLLVDYSIELWQQGGYGVVWNVHVSDIRQTTTVPDGAGTREITRDRQMLSITDKFLTRIAPYFEMIVNVERKKEETTKKVMTPRMIDGKTVNIPSESTVVRDAMVLTFKGDPAQDEPQLRLPMSRVPMPESIRLYPTEASPWAGFKAAYNVARSSIKWQ